MLMSVHWYRIHSRNLIHYSRSGDRIASVTSNAVYLPIRESVSNGVMESSSRFYYWGHIRMPDVVQSHSIEGQHENQL